MEQMERTIKTEVEGAAISSAYSDSEIDHNIFKQDPGLLQSVKSEPFCTNDALLKEEILVDSSQDGSEQRSVHDTSAPAGAGGVNEIFSTIPDDLTNIKYESAEMDIAPTVLQHMDTHNTLNKNMSTDRGANTVVNCYETMTGSGVKKENIEGEWRDGNGQQCVLMPSTTGGVIETSSTSLANLLNVKYKLAEMEIGPTVLQHMDTHYTIHKNMSAAMVENTVVVGCNDTVPGSGVKNRNLKGEWTDNKATSYNCNQITTEVDNDDAHMNSHLGQQKDFQKHLLHQHRTTNYNNFKCDTTFQTPHSLSLPEKLRQRNSRKAVTTRSTVTRTSDYSENNMTKIKQIPCQCDVCEKGYSLKAGMNLHKCSILKQKPRIDLKNNLVNYKSHIKQNSSVNLKNNLVNYHSSTKRNQSNCDVKFAQRGELTENMGVHLRKKPYQCKICDARFTGSCDLTEHMTRHTGKKPYQCKLCDERFAQSSALTQHVRVHTGEKPYQCNICDARFTGSCKLTKHMTSHTDEKPRQCQLCDARFAHLSALTRHMRVHTGEKPYQCKLCDARFAQSSALTQHVRVHTGEKPYQCNICDARFAQKNNLTQHMRYHTGEKPYECKICDARFAQNTQLTQHMRVHTGEKPYHCKICDASFSRSSILAKHLRVHTGVKRCRCKICIARCTGNDNLTRHMKVHMGEKSCDLN